MDFRRKFEVGLAWRTLVLIGAIWLFTKALEGTDIRAGRIIAAVIAVAAIASLWNFIRRTNLLISRFVESVQFQDYSQRFSSPTGGGFDELGESLDHAQNTLQKTQMKQAAEARYLAAIVDDAPSALLTIDPDGKIELLNKAARVLFARHALTRVQDLEELGPELAAAVALPPGARKITRLLLDGVPQRATFASAQVARLDEPVKIVSILPVQGEIGALEVAAQADLVRVLTHEIMNSLTPVTSLARSAADLVEAADLPPQLADAKIATATVARRSEGILRFVESYREFAHSPKIRRQKFGVQPWADEIMRLAATAPHGPQMDWRTEIKPDGLHLEADPELLAQAILNLLRNAVRATKLIERPTIVLSFAREMAGRCQIEVRDNGPGIPETQREDVFLPFFTTHTGGSGVGLSFARQVALAHGGSICALAAPEGGAAIRMLV